MSAKYSDRSKFTVSDIIYEIWESLGLPKEAVRAVTLQGEGHVLPSSFKIGHLAQASIALSALSASLFHALVNNEPIRNVTVPLRHAAVEFASERLYTINGKSTSSWGPIGGLHRTKDGHVRIHDNASHHRIAALRILGLLDGATRSEVADEVVKWNATHLEEMAARNGAVIYALRSYKEWDEMVQAAALPNIPVYIKRIGQMTANQHPQRTVQKRNKLLEGLKVVELTRVIAGPVAGRTLAFHGADVLSISSPNLPDLPTTDIDVNRGKRKLQLDLGNLQDQERLRELVKDADVFIQSYRPGSLANRGFGSEDLLRINPNIIYANLSAWGTQGPWRENRGFDSIVQTVSGMNVSEAEHFDPSRATPAKPLPVQCLDHGSGYLLATGICAALYRRHRDGGAWEVNISLASVMKYLCSLGQLPGREGFEGDVKMPEALFDTSMSEMIQTEYGSLRAVKHSAIIDARVEK